MIDEKEPEVVDQSFPPKNSEISEKTANETVKAHEAAKHDAEKTILSSNDSLLI